ncbi:hypothetical protein Tco_0530926 [Tanacetum coccineum]
MESGWKIQVVAADRLWEHIPTVGLMVVENKRCGERWIDTHLLDKKLKEVETVGECVDEIDKLAELTDEMQLKAEGSGVCDHRHQTNINACRIVVVADEHELALTSCLVNDVSLHHSLIFSKDPLLQMLTHKSNRFRVEGLGEMMLIALKSQSA